MCINFPFTQKSAHLAKSYWKEGRRFVVWGRDELCISDCVKKEEKDETQYFTGSNVNEIPEDFVLEETNININEATEVNGDVALTGNININNAFMAVGDIVFDGDVKNSNNSVIYSKYGSIVIDSQNVNLNGLVYAPFGDVVVKGQNLNLNSVIIIANKITCFKSA